MPRQRKHNKTSNWNTISSSKFRIGTRKAGVPANSLPTKQLLAIVSDSGKAKYHSKAYAVLKKRKNIAQSL